MPKLQFCVYVLQNQRDDRLYVGFTTDLHARLTAHFHGQVESTAPRRPFRLIYPPSRSLRSGLWRAGCEYHRSKADALRREQYLKTSAGKTTLKLMLRDAFTARAPALPRPACQRATHGRDVAGSAADSMRPTKRPLRHVNQCAQGAIDGLLVKEILSHVR